MAMMMESAVDEYRNARALMADAMRRNDPAAKEVARPLYLASLERLRREEVTA